jgi:hypothetical protein
VVAPLLSEPIGFDAVHAMYSAALTSTTVCNPLA